jgi:hypothetical protein
MPQAANIVINDGAASPVAHTFVPIGPDKDGVFWFEEQGVSSASIGNFRLSLEIKRPPPPQAGTSSKDRSYRMRYGIHTPILEVLSNNSAGYTPSPTVAYTPRLFVEEVVSERGNLQNRKDLIAFAVNGLANATVLAVLRDQQIVY